MKDFDLLRELLVLESSRSEIRQLFVFTTSSLSTHTHRRTCTPEDYPKDATHIETAILHNGQQLHDDHFGLPGWHLGGSIRNGALYGIHGQVGQGSFGGFSTGHSLSALISPRPLLNRKNDQACRRGCVKCCGRSMVTCRGCVK